VRLDPLEQLLRIFKHLLAQEHGQNQHQEQGFALKSGEVGVAAPALQELQQEEVAVHTLWQNLIKQTFQLQ